MKWEASRKRKLQLWFLWKWWVFKARWLHHFTGNCGMICGYQHPYGFVPECGCPIHDVEDSTFVESEKKSKKKFPKTRKRAQKFNLGEKMRDYTRIKYYLDSMNRIWHGPYCPYDTMHYKLIEKEAISHSNLPEYCVEISPLQAAQELERRN